MMLGYLLRKRIDLDETWQMDDRSGKMQWGPKPKRLENDYGMPYL